MRKANLPSFAAVEDDPQADKIIRKIAVVAVRRAAAENRRHGLPSVVIRRNQVLSVDQKNEEKVIATFKEGTRKYRPGQVFYARKD